MYCSHHKLRNSCERETFNARAIFSIFTSATFLSPRSIPPMYVRSSSHRSANASWETPSSCRTCLTVLPNLTRMSSIYLCASSLAFTVYVQKAGQEYGLVLKLTPIANGSGICGVISLHSRFGRISRRQRYQSLRACFGKSIVRTSELTH